MAARRYNKGKLRYDLIPHEGLKELADVYTKGAEKYTLYDEEGNIVSRGDDNWRSGQLWTDSMASVKRHLQAWEEGEDIDTDLGTKHLANAAWGLMSLLTYYKIHPELDNRKHKYLDNKRIALDIDGVICDFITAALKLSGVEIEDVKSFNWVPSYKLKGIWADLKEDKEFWLSLPRLVDPNELKFEPVAYVTSRSIPKEWCEEWIESNGFACNEVFVVDNDGSISKHGDKYEILKSLEIDIFVEDNYDQFLNLNKKGILTYLMDTQFNRRYDVGHKRITHLNQIV